MTDWFAVNAADGLYTAQDPIDPNIVYYESQGGNITRRNLATGEVANIKPRTVNITSVRPADRGDQRRRQRPPTEERAIADVRARMKREVADPNAALRWNWNTPFFLSVHDPNVFYSGADKVFKSVKKGRDPVAISPDLTAHDADWVRVSSGFDDEGNAATDASGGITRDATGAEENATISVMTESTIRAGLMLVGTDDGKVWLTRNDGGTWEDLERSLPGRAGADPRERRRAVAPRLGDDLRDVRQPPAERLQAVRLHVDRLREDVPLDHMRIFPAAIVRRRAYVIREDLVNPNLLYVGTETGVFASLNKGQSWFPLASGLPTVPVYDLKIHPRDHELIAGTHGRAMLVLDVAPLQQMTASALSASAHLFEPTVAFEYGMMVPPSETRAQRMWKSDGGPSGAEISYRLAAPVANARARDDRERGGRHDRAA